MAICRPNLIIQMKKIYITTRVSYWNGRAKVEENILHVLRAAQQFSDKMFIISHIRWLV